MEYLGLHQLQEMTEARKEAPKITSLKSYGFANGVDHLLQTVVNKELPMDELCIVYTDSSQLPTIQQAIERSGLAATYAEGIPLSHTKTYAFFNSFIEYILSGRQLKVFKKLVDEGQIKIEAVDNLRYLFNLLMTTDGMTIGARFSPLAKQTLEEAMEKGMPQALVDNEVAIRQLIDKMVRLEEKIEQLLAGKLKEAIEILLEISDSLYQRNSQASNIEYKMMKNAFESFLEYPLDLDLQAILSMIKGQNIHQSAEKPGHIHVTS